MAAPTRYTLSYAMLKGLALAAGFTGAAVDTIAAIAMAESGGDSQARSPVTLREDSRGILQINLKAHGTAVGGPVTEDCAFTPACAMAFAYSLSQRGTVFSDWSVYTSGAYRKYLNPATAAIAPAPDDPTKVGKGTDIAPGTEPGFLGVSPEEWKLFGIAFAVAAAATGLVALGAVGIVTGSGAGQTVIKVASKGLLAK